METGISALRSIINSQRGAASISETDRRLVQDTQNDLNLADPMRRLGGPHASPPLAAAPAAVIVLPVAAVGVTLNTILAILVAITAALLLALIFDRYREEIFAAIASMMQALINEVAALRGRVRDYHAKHGGGCHMEFDALIKSLNTLARRLNSPALSRSPSDHVLKAVGALLADVAVALLNFAKCMDPTDTMGLIDRFLRPNGILMRSIRRLINRL